MALTNNCRSCKHYSDISIPAICDICDPPFSNYWEQAEPAKAINAVYVQPQKAKTCGNCEKTDGLIYTSMPPQVKCTLSNKFHFMNDVCDIDKGGWIIREQSLCCPRCNFKFSIETEVSEYHYCPHCGDKLC